MAAPKVVATERLQPHWLALKENQSVQPAWGRWLATSQIGSVAENSVRHGVVSGQVGWERPARRVALPGRQSHSRRRSDPACLSPSPPHKQNNVPGFRPREPSPDLLEISMRSQDMKGSLPLRITEVVSASSPPSASPSTASCLRSATYTDPGSVLA